MQSINSIHAHIYYSDNKPVRLYVYAVSTRKFGEIQYGDSICKPSEIFLDPCTGYIYMFKITMIVSSAQLLITVDGEKHFHLVKVTPGTDVEVQLSTDLYYTCLAYILFMSNCGIAHVRDDIIRNGFNNLRIKMLKFHELLTTDQKYRIPEYVSLMQLVNICNIYIYKFGNKNIRFSRESINRNYLKNIEAITMLNI